MKKYIGILIVVLVMAGMVLLLISNKRKIKEQTSIISAENIVSVETVSLQTESYALDFSSNGVLQAEKELNYVSDVAGRVVTIFVDKGSHVKKGTPLLQIDSELLEADYRASLATYEALKKDEARFSRSNEAGGISGQQLDNIRTQLTAAKSRMEVSRRRLADATVKSPIEGTINMRYIELGSLIAPNVPLFDIVNNTNLKIICNVSESKVGRLSKGQSVTVTGNNYPGETFSGHINYIGIKTDRGLNYPVEIRMNRNDKLRIGMYMKVHFSSKEARTGLLVPRNAIIGSVKSANVYVMKDGKAVKREVTLGDMVGERVEILSGLNEGDRIITSGLMNVADGAAVKSIN